MKQQSASSGIDLTATTIRIAVSDEPYLPFSFKDATGRWAGFDMDLARAVCEAEHLTCDLVGVPWEHLFQALLDKKVDVIWSSMQVTDERKKIIAFADAYYESIHAFIGRASDPTIPDVADPKSLKGKIIGVQTATVSAIFAQQHFGDVAEVKLYDRQDDALAALKAGHVDYVSEFVVFLAPFLEENPGFAIKAVSPTDPTLNQGVAAAIRQEDTALRDKLNEGIAAVIRSGRYDEILKGYPGLSKEIRKPTI